jgi:hypothetical protein
MNYEELYAAYKTHRAMYRPHACTEHLHFCWVSHGPPAMSGSGICHGCKGTPRAQPVGLPVRAC